MGRFCAVTLGGWKHRSPRGTPGATSGPLVAPPSTPHDARHTVPRRRGGYMFVEVVQGRVTDAGQLRAAYDRWLDEVSPGAAGWLGTTAGVSGDGDFIALMRFESAMMARDNSRRPEHATWWERTAKLFAGEVQTAESITAYEDRGGASDRAGFVQVIQRRVRDVARARQILR